MKNKIISILMIIALLLITGCNNKNNNVPNETNSSSTTQNKSNGTQVREAAKDAINNEYGVILKSVAVEFVGDTLNLQVVMANETNDNKEFDCSKFSIKTQSGDVLKVNATSKKTINANSNYNQYAFTVEDEGKVSVNNIVYVYYDTTSLGPVEVTKF